MNRSFFRLAKSASECSEAFYPMGAVIVDKRPISVGYNKIKTHPEFANGSGWWTIHAEIDALIPTRFDVKGCDIYVYREFANGRLAMAKPCDACLAVLIECGIKNVYFTTDDGYGKIEL